MSLLTFLLNNGQFICLGLSFDQDILDILFTKLKTAVCIIIYSQEKLCQVNKTHLS